MKRKECKDCGKEYPVNKKNFKLLKEFKRGERIVRDYSARCLRNNCYQDHTNNIRNEYYHKKVEYERNKHLFKILVVRKAEIGSKTEPYYEGENFGYIPPSYEEIKKEYRL
jgi:hypothetical protein